MYIVHPCPSLLIIVICKRFQFHRLIYTFLEKHSKRCILGCDCSRWCSPLLIRQRRVSSLVISCIEILRKYYCQVILIFIWSRNYINNKCVLNPPSWGYKIIINDRQLLRNCPTWWSPSGDWSICSPAWIVFHNDFVRLKLPIVPWEEY